MKIPAVRAKIGSQTYYSTVLTFKQISDHVERIDENLYQSESLKDLIQRSITNNYQSIKEYILNQPELFFNSLVLAVYDNFPDWHQMEIKLGQEKYKQVGLLEFPGPHKIFPVDGQHRVEGIKEAIKDNPALSNEQIGVIFIGHKDNQEGKVKTRRIFTTLNRYAKATSERDNIALDEDDTVAIVTRDLVEDYDLFTTNRVVDVKGKAIPNNNKIAITSIVTLYQANLELFRRHYELTFEKKPTKGNIENYLKIRPADEAITSFKAYCMAFWDEFKVRISNVATYLATDVTPAAQFRNSEVGGNLLFRPVGLLPFVKACAYISKVNDQNFETILTRMDQIQLNINNAPWISVLWNAVENKMIMNTGTLTYLLLKYMYNSELLQEGEMTKLKDSYSARTGLEGAELDQALQALI